MICTIPRQRGAERGNALFLILIAVALFAALSYAVTQSGRGGGSIDKEQSLISASQITQFPAAVRTGVTRMVITGTDASTLDFVTATTGQSYEVFDTSGGGVIYQAPPANIGGATAWGFKDVQAAANGFYVADIGSNDDVIGREVIAYLTPLSSGICQSILKGLGLSITIASDTVDLTAGGAATYAAGSNTFSALAGQPFACVSNASDSGNNVYYHALLEQ